MIIMADATKRLATDTTLGNVKSSIDSVAKDATLSNVRTSIENVKTEISDLKGSGNNIKTLWDINTTLAGVAQAIAGLPNATQAAADNANAAAANAIEAIQELGGLVAGTYSSESTYNVGDYAYYESKLYKCVSPVTEAESWDKLKWIQAELSDEVTAISDDMCEFVSYTIVEHEWVDAGSGEFKSSPNWNRTDFIEIDPSEEYYVVGVYSGTNGVYNMYYDSNHNKIVGFKLNTGKTKLQPPGNAKYMALSGLLTEFGPKIFKANLMQAYDRIDLLDTVMQHDRIIPKRWTVNSLSQGNFAYGWVRLTSDFVPILGSAKYKVVVSNPYYQVFVTQYNENKQFINESGYETYITDPLYTETRTRYIKLTLRKTDDTTMMVSDAAKAGVYVQELEYIENKDYLDVMTYNMGCYAFGEGVGLPADIYEEKLINYRRFLGKYYPDILAMQEYDSRMDEENTIWANDVLYDYYYPYKYDTGSWESFKSKIKLTDIVQDKLISSDRWYIKAYITIKHKRILLINVHLSVGAANAETRAAEVNEILSMIPENASCIIFGDFNPHIDEEETLFKMFTDAGLNIANCGWFGKYYTWSSNRADFDNYDNPSGNLWYVDNIIVSQDLKIVNVESLPGVYKYLSSDHIPLMARIKI